MLKENLRDYRRLGLYVESRIALRKAMARFWARGNADQSIERSMRPQIENRPLRIWSDDRDCAGTAETVSPTRQI
jgi:hypothetical protein